MASVFLKEHNLLFVHTPKTAGTSLCRWLSENESIFPDITKENRNQHYQMGKFKRIFDVQDIDDYFLCCRDPYTWVQSFYHHQVQRIDENIHHLNVPLEHISYVKNEHYKTFEHWVMNFDKSDSRYLFLDEVVCTGQSAYIHHNKEPKFIMRYEHLNDDLKYLENILGKKINLPITNVSKNTKTELDTKIKKKIYNIFEKDFVNFDYKMRF